MVFSPYRYSKLGEWDDDYPTRAEGKQQAEKVGDDLCSEVLDKMFDQIAIKWQESEIAQQKLEADRATSRETQRAITLRNLHPACGPETAQQKQERLLVALHKVFGDKLPDFLDSIRGEATRKMGNYPVYTDRVDLQFTHDLSRDVIVITDSLGGQVELDSNFCFHPNYSGRDIGLFVWRRLQASQPQGGRVIKSVTKSHEPHGGGSKPPSPSGLTVTLDLDDRYLNDATRDTIRVGRALLQTFLT